MDAVQSKLQSKLPKSRKDLKPNRTHAFHGVIWFLGWLCPPIAILVRFGVGWDFFINIILTICGYIPGHAHNFVSRSGWPPYNYAELTEIRPQYCQNVRNNKTKNRTPRWAIRAGLVKMNDPRAGRHQWAYRYDERVAGAGAYGEDADSLRSDSWDGRGPEPQKQQRSTRTKNGNQRHRFSPWGDIVNDDEVEGEPQGGLYRSRSNLATPPARAEPAHDPLTNEQFYATPAEVAPEAPRKSKKKFGSGLIKNRSRYEQQPFETDGLQASRTRSRTQDEYQDEFEREINGGSAAGASPVGGSGAAARFDSFDQEGPEDAWATSRPAPPAQAQAPRSNGAPAQRLQPQKTGRAEENDGDLFQHSF
ncbi:hypothetical protein JCM10450v2_001940 [Rhodotorula kratochvilovae]